MKVTTERTRGSRGSRASRRRPRPRRRLGRLRVSLGVVGLLAYSGLVFGAGIAFFDLLSPMLQDLSGSQSTGRAIRSLVSGPANYLRALANPNAAPQLTIDVKFKHLHKLHQKREQALDSGLLRPTPEDFIPASLTLDGHVVEVDMRLTGHMPEPLEGEKWPLEIRVKGGDHLLGMRRFTLEPPEFRGFQAEGFFLDHLRREGVLAPRFSLLEVTRNGRNIGLMAMEELPSTELLVSQGRKSGAIIRFDDSSYWEAYRTGRQTPFDSPFTARIQAVNEDEIAESSRLQENLESATGLLRGFLAGSLRASEVFDVELLGRFLAVAEIWRTREALGWRNARYYFNPLNARMSPIGNRGNLHSPYLGDQLVSLSQPYTTQLLDDPIVRDAFARALQRIANEVADGNILEELAQAEKTRLAILHREYPFRARLDFSPIEIRALALRGVDSAPFDPLDGDGEASSEQVVYSNILRAYTLEDELGPYLELANSLPVPVYVTTLRHTDIDGGDGGGVALPWPVAFPIELPPTPYQTPPRAVRVHYRAPEGKKKGLQIEGTALVAGQQRAYTFLALPYYASLDANPVPRANLQQVLAKHPFLSWDADAKLLRAAAGSWDVDGSLILPDDVGLAVPAGTTLRFQPRQLLLARGPLLFAGTEDAPVVLEGPPGEKPSQLWSGIALLESTRPSRWSHTVIRNTGPIDRDGWALSAGVLVRKTHLELEHCTFSGDRSDDALHLRRSSFAFTDIEIIDSAGDALDGYFARGSIDGGRITRAGRNGIHVAGSRVSVRNFKIEDVRDEALSATKDSLVEADGLDIERVGIAFAATGAVGEIRNSRIRDVVRVAFLAYVKEPEFGPGKLRAQGNRVEGAALVAVAQHGSEVVVDGESVPTVDVDLESLSRHGAGT